MNDGPRAKPSLRCFCKELAGSQPHSLVYVQSVAAFLLQWQKGQL